jgi:hypothetical protein
LIGQVYAGWASTSTFVCSGNIFLVEVADDRLKRPEEFTKGHFQKSAAGNFVLCPGFQHRIASASVERRDRRQQEPRRANRRGNKGRAGAEVEFPLLVVAKADLPFQHQRIAIVGKSRTKVRAESQKKKKSRANYSPAPFFTLPITFPSCIKIALIFIAITPC